MNEIRLSNVKPSFLNEIDHSGSEIWFRDIRFKKGERYLLAASSGAGKTSLFAYMFGERRDYKGEIRFDERPINSFNDRKWNNIRREQASLVFQDLRLFEGLTVMENIELKNGLTDRFRRSLVDNWLRRSGIADKANERIERLSFGQRQRAAIIRALCQPFDFLLLDEPFSHLDRDNIQTMTEIIAEEVCRVKAGLILCSLGDEYDFEYSTKYKL